MNIEELENLRNDCKIKRFNLFVKERIKKKRSYPIKDGFRDYFYLGSMIYGKYGDPN